MPGRRWSDGTQGLKPRKTGDSNGNADFCQITIQNFFLLYSRWLAFDGTGQDRRSGFGNFSSEVDRLYTTAPCSALGLGGRCTRTRPPKHGGAVAAKPLWVHRAIGPALVGTPAWRIRTCQCPSLPTGHPTTLLNATGDVERELEIIARRPGLGRFTIRHQHGLDRGPDIHPRWQSALLGPPQTARRLAAARLV